jgi:hypothetical protein
MATKLGPTVTVSIKHNILPGCRKQGHQHERMCPLPFCRSARTKPILMLRLGILSRPSTTSGLVGREQCFGRCIAEFQAVEGYSFYLRQKEEAQANGLRCKT